MKPKNRDIRKLAEYYNLKAVVIPQHERADGNYPPPWLTRRMTQRIDTRVC